MQKKPNIVLILNDDMGYSDLGCYGGEIDSKNLNFLAENGLRFTQFYNTARCCPSRASLLTGLHPHQAGVGHMVNDMGPEEYSGRLNDKCVTIAEVLKTSGYGTYMSGKWHITRKSDIKKNIKVAWPKQRGFDHCYCFLAGAASYYWPAAMVRDNEFIDEEIKNDSDYYITNAIADNAVKYINEHTKNQPEDPFFLYVAFTAPHWPLHAKPDDIEKYKGRFGEGWDKLREQRMQRMIEMGIIDEKWELTQRDPTQIPWDAAKNKDWEQKRMETYAAQIDSMDQGIGKIIDNLKEQGIFEETLIIFLSDNGGCAECANSLWKNGKVNGFSGQAFTKDGRDVVYGNDSSLIPGTEDTYQSYGVAWANLSNTPFRMYKSWTHEGGIATPLIVHWPNGIKSRNELRHDPGQLPDIMATIVEITGSKYPDEFNHKKIHPSEGNSLVPLFENTSNDKKALYFEHQGNSAIRMGDWKLVRDYPYDWELYNIKEDRSELDNLSKKHPNKKDELLSEYQKWAQRIGVKDRIDLISHGSPKIAQVIPRYLMRFKPIHRRWQKIIKMRMKKT